MHDSTIIPHALSVAFMYERTDSSVMLTHDGRAFELPWTRLRGKGSYQMQ